ncbi:unnamed protein product [Amaranthus hypochondriacus]
MIEFDVILGMDWLSKHYATFHCRDQKIVLKGPKGRRISYSGVVAKKRVKLVSALRMRRMHRKGETIFLCRVKDLTLQE